MAISEACTMDRECEYCGKKIPKSRLDVLPNTTTCVACSVETGYIGIITTDERLDGIDVQLTKPDSSDPDAPRKATAKKKHRPKEDDED